MKFAINDDARCNFLELEVLGVCWHDGAKSQLSYVPHIVVSGRIIALRSMHPFSPKSVVEH